MAREYDDSLATLAGGYKVNASIPLDTRVVVPNASDLCARNTWVLNGVSTCYPGIVVTVLGRDHADEAGVYYFKGTDPTQYSTAENWQCISAGGGDTNTIIGIASNMRPSESEAVYYWLDTSHSPASETLYKADYTSGIREWKPVDVDEIKLGTNFIDFVNEITYTYSGVHNEVPNWVTNTPTVPWGKLSL